MKYRFRDVPILLQSPFGRSEIRLALVTAAFPLLGRLAQAHRQTLARRTRVVAVTGSFGKSTTVRAIGAVLGLTSPSWGANWRSFVAGQVLRLRPWQRHAVLEVGIIAPGEMGRTARFVQPDVAVVTSIGSEHLSSQGTLETTRREKFGLVQALRPGGVAVLNGDDPHVRWMREQSRARVLTFGFGADHNVRACDVRPDWPRGTRFTVQAGSERRAAQVRLHGRHQLYAALAAVAVGLVEGVPLDQALAALEPLEPTPGRLQTVVLPNDAILLRDDYKAPYESFERALDLLAELPVGRRFAVLGDISEPPVSMGAAYRQIGQQAARAATRIVLVGHQVRRYRTGLRTGGLPPAAVTYVDDLFAAADLLRRELQPGDVVLVKAAQPQRFERLTLLLQGQPVVCALQRCPLQSGPCRSCAMLERGWLGAPPPKPQIHKRWRPT